jgi:uncharacterized protein YigE (DUF2233 family)
LKKKRRKRLFRLIIFAFMLWFAGLFNPIANLHFYIDQSNPLDYELSSDLVELCDNESVNVKELSIKRTSAGTGAKTLTAINPPRVRVITFKQNQNNFEITFSEGGLTSRKNVGGDVAFSVNSNFYDTEQKTLGEVIVNGERHGYETGSSGYFKVIEGKAYVGPRSLFEDKSGNIEFACQAHPSVMKDGIIWPYILNETLNKASWGRKTYRNLGGMDKEGNIVFVLSGDGALLSVKEISEIALDLGVQTATLFDAGSSLQYTLKTKGCRLNFAAYNNQLNLGAKFDHWFKENWGYLFFNTAPVFINY